MAGRTLGINAALPQPPQLTKAQIGNRFVQSLAAGAKTGAAVPNPAGLTRDEADTFRSQFYKQFYSGQPVQRIDDTLVPMTGRGIAAPTLTEKYASANPVNQLGYAPVSGSVGRVFNSPGNYAPENFAYSVQRAKEMTAPPERTPQWDKSLRALADMAYRGFMAPSRAMNGYYDQFVIDPETGRVVSMSDPRMIDDAAALAGFAQTGGIPLVGPRVAAAAIPRATAAAAIPRVTAAGIDAAPLTPRQVDFRQFMDRVYAGERAAAATPTPAVSAGPRIPQGGISPTPAAVSPAEIARLDDILAKLNSVPRPATPSVQPSVVRLPTPTNLIDEGIGEKFSVRPSMDLSEEISRLEDIRLNAAINARNSELDGSLIGPVRTDPIMSVADLDALMYNKAVDDALGVGPTLARAEQLAPPAATGGNPATGRNAFMDVLDAIEAEKAALAARSGELFPDINPAATISDPMDVFGPQRPALPRQLLNSYPTPAQWMDTVGPRRVTDTPQSPFTNSYPDMLDLVGPQRPDFMFPDEAADIIRPGPRVAADNKRMDPFTKKALITAAGGIATLPVIGGLSLLANGQLGPAPTATTPQPEAVPDEPRGIDAVDPRAAYAGAQSSMRDAMNARRLAEADAEWATLPPAPAAPGVKFGDVKVLNGEPVKRDALGRIVPVVNPNEERLVTEDIALDTGAGGLGDVVAPDVPAGGQPVDRGVISGGSNNWPAWTSRARADRFNEVEPTLDIPGYYTRPVAEDAQNDMAAFDAIAASDGDVTNAETGVVTPGEPSEGTAPVAGTKFTPGPGQFVGTNGYIYEQSSDGSFEKVGKVPGYTPAQLSEAANKGAFRDPNNIVTGGAKPRKQVKKKGEKNFIDKAGDILKERFDDSLFARLFLNQDDEAVPEAAATGPEAVEYYSTPPSSVPESLVSSSGSSKKRKKKDENETDGGTGGTGTGGTGTSPYTPEVQAMLNALYGNYMRQYNGPGVGYVPGVDPERNYFTPAFADGGLVDGRLVLGDGGPKEDKIPATIDGVEQAKLSNGEFVMTAAAVKNAGDGDIELGAKRLMDLNNMLSYGRPAERLKVQHVK
jgi:hypothetical protein